MTSELARTAVEQQHYARALELYTDLARQGDAEAQVYLGWMYQNGQGTRPDPGEALRWYQLAAEAGNSDACFRLGDIHERSHDWPRAREWYEKAAQRSHMVACWRLANLYRVSSEVMSEAGAMRWLAAAAGHGHYPSRFLLLRQMWDGRTEGGRVKAVTGLVKAIVELVWKAIRKDIRAGDERLQK